MMSERTVDIEDARLYVGERPVGVSDVHIQIRQEVTDFHGRSVLAAKDATGNIASFDVGKYRSMDEHGIPEPIPELRVERDGVGEVILKDVIITTDTDTRPAHFIAADYDAELKENA